MELVGDGGGYGWLAGWCEDSLGRNIGKIIGAESTTSRICTNQSRMQVWKFVYFNLRGEKGKATTVYILPRKLGDFGRLGATDFPMSVIDRSLV